MLLFDTSFTNTKFNALAQSDAPAVAKYRIDDRDAQASALREKLRNVSGERILNHYIVVLKDIVHTTTTPDPLRAAAEEARSQGAVLRHIYEHTIRGFAIKVPNDTVLDSIMKNPNVEYIQPDVKVKAFSQSLPTGINRVDGDLSSTKSGDGKGSVDVDIAILDTGIDLSHPDLNVYRQVTFVSGTSSGNDDYGHGTLVAGVAAAKDDSQGVVGMAAGARLWAVKVLDKNGNGFDSDILAGIDYITEHAEEIDVVNMSFGGDGPDDALHTAIVHSVAAGVTYTGAAGNEGVNAASVIPASFPEVIAVSAIVDTDGKCGGVSTTSTDAGKDDTFASFSNFGSVVDIAAPGVLIKSTARGGSYASFSGTSASTPFVTGAAALYGSEHPSASPSDIRNALRSLGSTPSTLCDGKGHGYFKGDRDTTAEPLLYVGGITSANTDTTPPTVVSTNPSNGATGVAAATSVTGTFSESVQSSTVTTSTFTLKNSVGNPTSAAVSLSTDGKVASLKPSSPLEASTTYTATMAANIKDLAGNTMTPEKSWSFTTAPTAPPLDTTPPTVKDTTPHSGATGVAFTSSITATFDEAVQPASISTSTFTLKNGAGTSIPGAVTLNGLVATFNPASSLSPSTSYTAMVTTGVKDIAGNTMTSAKSWSFTTVAADTSPPPSPSSCDNNLIRRGVTSSGSQTTYPASNAIDNNLKTRWWSTFIANPWIRTDLGLQQTVCSVTIAFADGSSHQYNFIISLSLDGIHYSNVFSGKSSGTTTLPQKYNFAETQAKYVKITITNSHVGSSPSIAQISEIAVFGKPSESSTTSNLDHTQLSSQSQSRSLDKNNKDLSTTKDNIGHNHSPIAKNDNIKTEINKPVLVDVLDNDFDSDNDTLVIKSSSHHSKNAGKSIINGNGTITFSPFPDFHGIDIFSYTITDGKGKSDEGKVSINIVPGEDDPTNKLDLQKKFPTYQQEPVEKQKESRPNYEDQKVMRDVEVKEMNKSVTGIDTNSTNHD